MWIHLIYASRVHTRVLPGWAGDEAGRNDDDDADDDEVGRNDDDDDDNDDDDYASDCNTV